MTHARHLLDQLLEAPMYSFEPVHRAPDEMPDIKFNFDAGSVRPFVPIYRIKFYAWAQLSDGHTLVSQSKFGISQEIFRSLPTRSGALDVDNPPDAIVYNVFGGREGYDEMIAQLRKNLKTNYDRWKEKRLAATQYTAPVAKRPTTKVVPFNVAELKGKLGDLKYIYAQVKGVPNDGVEKSANLELLANLAHEMEPGEKIYRIIKDTGMPDPETSMSSTAAIYFAATPEEAQGVFELVDAVTRAKAKKRMRGGV